MHQSLTHSHTTLAKQPVMLLASDERIKGREKKINNFMHKRIINLLLHIFEFHTAFVRFGEKRRKINILHAKFPT